MVTIYLLNHLFNSRFLSLGMGPDIASWITVLLIFLPKSPPYHHFISFKSIAPLDVLLKF